MSEGIFARCKVCNQQWPSRDAFIADDGVHLIGYQVNFFQVEKGLFLFNHTCDATLAIPAGSFADLYDGPIYHERKTGSDECPSYCLYQHELRPCPAKCDCAYIREILKKLDKQALSA